MVFFAPPGQPRLDKFHDALMLFPALTFNFDGFAELEVYRLIKVQGPEVFHKAAVAPEVGL